ncbi:hypothetical protein MSS4_04001 [Mycobacterium marinum]|nr:hypothetical protein [Mycobacterium marinum]EPQ74812.1 hypothetical protein MMEU_2472 [Mycobacterium marinum str. Europe]RFZ04638.1 hypothetical protein DE4381_04069 [Mycobacterium marinum]RFZ21864.1 hypothetical protein DSM44344_03576 [Mycobacterium marinum]RFZ29197.1 hypothetical protein DSM43519_00120 [Mycobacterium marinum]RFZ44662.1 hypothetical protein MSS4_04001 [Mycobacterium marinum]
MLIKFVDHSIESLGEQRELSMQLLAHPQPLRALPREHQRSLTGAASISGQHRPRWATLSQISQPRQKLFPTGTNDHSPMFEHRPLRQRPPDIKHAKVIVSAQVFS